MTCSNIAKPQLPLHAHNGQLVSRLRGQPRSTSCFLFPPFLLRRLPPPRLVHPLLRTRVASDHRSHHESSIPTSRHSTSSKLLLLYPSARRNFDPILRVYDLVRFNHHRIIHEPVFSNDTIYYGMDMYTTRSNDLGIRMLFIFVWFRGGLVSEQEMGRLVFRFTLVAYMDCSYFGTWFSRCPLYAE